MLAAIPALAHAQSVPAGDPFPARVRVRPPACEPAPFDVEAFVALLRVELVTDGVGSVDVTGTGASVDPGSLAVIALETTDCTAGASVLVVIDDAATRKQVRRMVDVSDVPERSRPRTLALAVAELLRASWAEIAMPDAPPPARVIPSGVRIAASERMTALRPAAYATGPARSLGLALDVRVFPVFQDGSSVLTGGRIAGEFALGTRVPVALHLDAGAAAGTIGDPLGQITVGIATAGAALVLTGGTESLRLGFGPRVEAGYGWVSGQAASGSTPMASGAAPIMFASVLGIARLRLFPRLWATADLEVGATLVGLVADAEGRRAAGAAGPMVAFRLGIAAGL